MWIPCIGFTFALHILLVQATETENALESCASCLCDGISNWSCNVNGHVAKSNSNDVKADEVLAELQGEIEQLKEKVNKHETSRCAFAARGLSSDRTIDSSPIVFKNVDLNICNGYNATTGVFKSDTFGTFMFSMHVKAAGNSEGPIAIRRNDDDIICNAWVSNGPGEVSSCSGVVHLYFGDKVKVTGSNADTAIIKKSHNGFSGFLI